jgi:hypothetical protein
VHFRSAFFAIVVVVMELIFGFKSHTQAMLPDFTRLTLHHEFASIWVVLYLPKHDESDARRASRYVPVLPQTHRVMPCSSSGSPGEGSSPEPDGT